jgi:urease accessory protein
MNPATERLSHCRRLVAISLLLFLPSFAHAHTGTSPVGGFAQGVAHPLTGFDHVCAMIAVGLWAAQRGGRALWLVPLAFVGVMTLGGLLGMVAVSLPFAERGIVMSVLILGILIAAAIRLPLAASALIVGLFALCHGHVHGTEMPETASGVAYGFGFVVSTVILHASGIGMANLFQRFGNAPLIRYAGSAIACCGLYLCLA